MLPTPCSRVDVNKAIGWCNFLLLALLVGVAFAETQIDIESTMSGKHPNDIYLIVRNLGPDPIEGLEIYVDGSLEDKLELYLPAGRAVKVYASIPFGEHTVIVKGIPSGEDSIELTVSEFKETTTTTVPEEEGNNTLLWIGIGILTVVILVVIAIIFSRGV